MRSAHRWWSAKSTRIVSLSVLAVVVSLLLGIGDHWRRRRAVVGAVCTIGTDNAFPYHYMTADGQVTGLAADVVNEAARRAGIRLRWSLHPEGPTLALQAKKVQVWPLLSTRPSFWPEFHFTKPYIQNTYVLLTVDPELAAPEAPARVRTIAMANFPLVKALTTQIFPRTSIIGMKNRETALSALCRGEVDAAVMEARSAQRAALVRPPDCGGTELHAIGLEMPSSPLGLASTREGAALADRLSEEIDGMLADGSMARLLRRWNYYYSGEAETIYRANEAYSARRLSLMLAAGLGLLSILLFFSLVRMRRAKRAALAANAAKSQFLANMSHEIRTPLHGILGLTQILADTPLQAEQRDLLEMMDNSGRVLVGIVDDLLDLSRIERGRLVVQVAPMNPAALLRDTVRVFGPHAVAKGVKLELAGLECLPPSALGDAVRVRQVLSNLISNALKFTPHGSVRVDVSCDRLQHPPRATIRVVDTGIGIAPENQAGLFQKFVQADSSIGRRFGGTGLGLAIAKQLVEAMGGSIGMESAYGRGSTFWFELPLPESNNRGDAPPLLPGAAASMPAPSAAPAPARILLAEDNPVNQTIAKRLLERAGHNVTIVGDGESAVQAWQAGRFDAVFMDCQMPGIDGYEATGEIRKLEHGLRHTPIIALTAAAMDGERKRCLEAGMDDYLTKPIDLAELNRVLHSWVEPSAGLHTARSPVLSGPGDRTPDQNA